jgi:HEAT repeat protein
MNAFFFLATFTMAVATGRIGKCQNPSSENEPELIAVLRSDAPAADKALACKHLAIYGSSEAVPDLARLLTDESLASWSRIALEVIPGPEADEAMRKAMDSVHGRLLVGVINSIGVRRDAGAVNSLIGRLQDPDAEIASAAAVALGRIGDSAAAQTLRQALVDSPAEVRSAVAEGCVLCAERCLSEGNAIKAAEIYDDVRKADVPRQRTLEAARGAILARKQDGIPLLLEQIESPDEGLFQAALSTAREFPGNKVDEALAAALVRTPPERAALLILAMADRTDTVDLSAILEAAGHGPKQVRIAAIGALGRVGDATCVSPLLEIALEPDAELVRTAKTALAELPDENVDKDIVARLAEARGKPFSLLIEIVGQRRIQATAVLEKALDHSDPTVRSAALTSLGNTVPAESLSVLISQVVDPNHPDDALVARQALKTASIRMPDREACAMELATAIERSSSSTQSALLEILGAMGGTRALDTIGTAAKSVDPQLQDVSSRLLGQWMTIDAAPVLLDLAKTAPDDKYQIRALRGYIRIARQFNMSEQQRVEMCRNAFEVARQPAEQKLVLEVLKRYPNPEMLKLAFQAVQIPELKDEATQATLAIAQRLGNTDEVRERLSKVDSGKVNSPPSTE